jgi:D-cysteine desulfhydrase
MAAPPRVQLALAPTPILRLERLSRQLGAEIYVKRDDLTGLLESGNKVRKLEFLAGEALAAGADTLVTCGTAQSNCCRAVAAVAARLGLGAVVAVKGEPPEVYDGNLLLDHLLGAEVRHVPDSEFERQGELLDRLADEIRQRGRRPYLIPESGANAVGALGYLECAVELADQVAHGAPRFDSVVIAAFSGSSLAGLHMGKQLTGLPADIVGVPVARGADEVRGHVTHTIETAVRRFGLAVEPPRTIRLLDGYQGAGRARIGDEELEIVLALGRQEGVLLDPVYTAKAFLALTTTLRRDPTVLGRRVCFIHTGGLFSLFACREELSRRLGAARLAR